MPPKHTDWERVPFPREEYERRMACLRAGMEPAGLDGLVVCGAPKRSGYVRYVSNFDSYYGTTFVLVPRQGSPVLITDSHFRQEPMQTGLWMTWIEEVRWARTSPLLFDPRELLKLLEEALAELHPAGGAVGVVGEEALYPALYQGFRTLLTGEGWKSAFDLFHRVACRKSPAEIDLMARIGRAMDGAIGEFLDALRPGVSEAELFAVLAGSLFREGVQNFFGTVPPVLVSGDRTRLKSVPPGPRRIERGDLVFFDVEPELEGYYLDISRTAAAGTPSPKTRSLMEASLAAEGAFFSAARPGVSVRKLREEALRPVKEMGLDRFFYFKLHGMGTSRPAYPLVDQLDFVLEEGMSFTLESILVDPDAGTGTIENAYVMTAEGARRLVWKGMALPLVRPRATGI